MPIPHHPVIRIKMGASHPLLPGCAKRQKRGDQAEGDLGVARNVTKREQPEKVIVDTGKPLDFRRD